MPSITLTNSCSSWRKKNSRNRFIHRSEACGPHPSTNCLPVRLQYGRSREYCILGDARTRQLLSHCLTLHEHGAGYEHAWPYDLRDKVPEMEDYLEHTDEPGPGALIVFDEDDLVEACFTEQMQYLGQDNPIGSSLMLFIDLNQDSESLDRAVKASFDRLGAMVRS